MGPIGRMSFVRQLRYQVIAVEKPYSAYVDTNVQVVGLDFHDIDEWEFVDRKDSLGGMVLIFTQPSEYNHEEGKEIDIKQNIYFCTGYRHLIYITDNPEEERAKYPSWELQLDFGAEYGHLLILRKKVKE